jgi:hypothetical protein
MTVVVWLSVVAVPAVPAVGTNHPPVLDPIGDKTVVEGTMLMFLAHATDPDPGDILTFSLGATRPDGAVIDSRTGLFSWTPTESQGPGVYTFDVVVRDGAQPPGEDSEEITVTVTEVNRAPVLGFIADRAVEPGSTLSFTATATDPDLPSQVLTFSLAGAPGNAAINASTGVFSWTPTASQVGSWSLKICVSDGSLSTCQWFGVWVGTNRPPVIDSLGVASTSYIAWDERLSFSVSAHDPDGASSGLHYSLVGAPSGASITSSGTFTWTPASSQMGSHVFDVRVTDSGSPPLSADARMTVVVQKRVTTLVYASQGYGGPVFSDEMECYGYLRDASGGSRHGTALANATIRFEFGGQSAVAKTDVGGKAETGFMVDDAAGTYAMLMSYAGSSLYQPASYSGWLRVSPERSFLHYTGDRHVGAGGHTWVGLSARVQESLDGTLGHLLDRQQIVFEVYRAGSLVRMCTANVVGAGASAGVASCDKWLGPGRYHVVTRLAPNGYYTAERVRTLLVVR